MCCSEAADQESYPAPPGVCGRTRTMQGRTWLGTPPHTDRPTAAASRRTRRDSWCNTIDVQPRFSGGGSIGSRVPGLRLGNLRGSATRRFGLCCCPGRSSVPTSRRFGLRTGPRGASRHRLLRCPTSPGPGPGSQAAPRASSAGASSDQSRRVEPVLRPFSTGDRCPGRRPPSVSALIHACIRTPSGAVRHSHLDRRVLAVGRLSTRSYPVRLHRHPVPLQHDNQRTDGVRSLS